MLDPGVDLDGVELGGEDAGGGLNHREQSRDGDGEEKQGKQKFAVAGAQAEGGEESSVDDKRPGAQRQDEGEEPAVAEGVEVEEEMKMGARTASTISDEEHVGEGFAEEERGGGGGAMRWASRTWLRCSRVQDWLRAVMEAKRSATQRMPPAIWRVVVG